MIKYLILSQILVSSCGQFGEVTGKSYQCTMEGKHCHEKVTNDDSSEGRFTVEGVPGPAGRDGTNGTNGTEGAMGSSGSDGESLEGPQGPAGTSGTSCTVTGAVNGALIQCGDNSILVLNGINGTDGTNGQDGSDGQDAPPTSYTVVGLVDPCGDAPGIYDEVFLRLQNGMLIASFSDNSNGKNTRFSVLTPGSYSTTDGSNCYFSINNSLQLENEH